MLHIPRVQSGQRFQIPAALVNAVADLDRASRENRWGSAREAIRDAPQATVVKVKNLTGAARSRFSVLGIEDPMVDPSTDQAAALHDVKITGETPALADHLGKFCILLQPLGANEVGDAVVAGVTWAQVDMDAGTGGTGPSAETLTEAQADALTESQADAMTEGLAAVDSDYVDIADGETDHLVPRSNGCARILWSADTTGVVWAIIRIGNPKVEGVPPRKFELKDTLTPGGTATAYQMPWSGSAYVTDTSEEFEVVDTLGTYRGRAKGTEHGSYGEAAWSEEAQRWEITQIEPHALRIKCQVDMGSGLSTTDSTITVDNVLIMQPTGAILLAEVTEIDNNFDWEADDDARVDAVWDEAAQAWSPTQVKCKAGS